MEYYLSLDAEKRIAKERIERLKKGILEQIDLNYYSKKCEKCIEDYKSYVLEEEKKTFLARNPVYKKNLEFYRELLQILLRIDYYVEYARDFKMYCAHELTLDEFTQNMDFNGNSIEDYKREILILKEYKKFFHTLSKKHKSDMVRIFTKDTYYLYQAEEELILIESFEQYLNFAIGYCDLAISILKNKKDNLLLKKKNSKPKTQVVENNKRKSNPVVIDIYGMSMLIKKIMSIIKSKDGEYIINNVPEISNEIKKLVKDLIELRDFDKELKYDNTIISRKYEILSARIYQYLHLRAKGNLTEEEQIMLLLLEQNNILDLLEKNKHHHGEHYFTNIIPNINKKIEGDLDKLFGYNKVSYFDSYMLFSPEQGFGLKIHLGALTYLMSIDEINKLYHKYRVAFRNSTNTRLNHSHLQKEFCDAIKYNKHYKSLLKYDMTDEEKMAEELYICAAFLGVLPAFINSKEELIEKILTNISDKKISSAICQFLNEFEKIEIIDIPPVKKK